MSLEALIENLTKALNDNTAALKAAGGTAKGAAADKAGDGEKTESRGRGRPAGSTNKDKGGDKDKHPSEDDIRKVFGEFMRVDDEDERESRKTYVKNVLKQYGVAKATDLKPEDRAEAISVIEDEAKKRASGDGEDDDLV